MRVLLYPEDVGAGMKPEQPDLFVYRDSPQKEYFFVEVKSYSDKLREPQIRPENTNSKHKFPKVMDMAVIDKLQITF